jgi:hypothetical protein
MTQQTTATETFEEFVVRNPYMLGHYEFDVKGKTELVAEHYGPRAAAHYLKEQKRTNRAHLSFYEHVKTCQKLGIPCSSAL